MLVTVAHIMSHKIVTVDMDDSLATAKAILDEAGFHHLMVVNSQKHLVGILSDRDLLRTLSPNLNSKIETTKDLATLKKRVHQIMTRHPKTVEPSANIDVASQVLLSNDIGCMPVVQQEQIVGIITWRDLLHAYCEYGVLSRT